MLEKQVSVVSILRGLTMIEDTTYFGVLKFFKDGYGFITVDCGGEDQDVFFHYRSLRDFDTTDLVRGMKMGCITEMEEGKGWRAKRCWKVEESDN